MGLLTPSHAAMLLAFSQPDIPADAATGKRTTAVRIGEGGTSVLQTTLVSCAVAGAAVLGIAGPVDGAGWALLGAPAAAVQVWASWRRRYGVLTVAATTAFALAVAGLLFGAS
jgi:1,4-dihydroxy-2-naphthoate octaprenyltransferase